MPRATPGGAMAEPIRIAMWSGPRNISTAMMRAFENRSDTAVIDEPFYAAYLAATGIDHPLRAESLAAQPTDWRDVLETILGPVPGGKPIFYQKHMTHHMLPGFDLDWTKQCRNVFLIRAPGLCLPPIARNAPNSCRRMSALRASANSSNASATGSAERRR